MLEHTLVVSAQHILVAEAGVFPLDAVARGQILSTILVLKHLNLFLCDRLARPHILLLGKQSPRTLQRLFDYWFHLTVLSEEAFAVDEDAELLLVKAMGLILQRLRLHLIRSESELVVGLAFWTILGIRIVFKLEVGADAFKRRCSIVDGAFGQVHLLFEKQLRPQVFLELRLSFLLAEIALLLKVVHLIDQFLLILLIFLIFL